MIKVTGSIKRAFVFPADTNTALFYYSELERITQFMPHINPVEVYEPNQIRVLYKTLELGSYAIRIFCDLHSTVELDEQTLLLQPLNKYQPVESKASINTTTGQGIFSLSAKFFELDEHQTRVEYEIILDANLPRPLGMRLMPRRVVNRIAKNITDSRIREIADGFIAASVAAFPEWAAENEPIIYKNAL
ncbi:MAG: hypothetical protein DWQ04_07655 [Chloroflexi bacterium]|nr:MAG: hypothetical protein DWQ04_07655 [Chloroflexota bacterium]